MTKAEVMTPREALLNEPLIGFQADIDGARKVAGTTSGKEGKGRSDSTSANTQPVLGMGAETVAKV